MARRGGGRIVNVTAGSAEASRIVEEPPQIESVAGKNVLVPGYSASKRALDRLGNAIAPEIARHNVFVVNLHPGWVETEMVAARLKDKPGPTDGPGGRPVPMAIPARMIVYFAACENPREYNGRVFWAERELADMGIPVD
jgi:NAD(P)-dependent dehydrogenase (short-subunit alcohol dehydrogenase family)